MTRASAQEAGFWTRLERAVGRDHFNEEQLAAVQAGDGPMLIEAGPGSGKTTVLTWRVVYLLTAMDVSAERICVVTFTRAAAEELKERIDNLMAAGTGSEPVSPRSPLPIRATTIHSLAGNLLRRAGRLTGRLRFLSEHEQLDVVRELLRRESVSLTDELPGEVLSEIGAARNRMQPPQKYTPNAVPSDVFVRVAQRYRAWKREQGCLDYDDLLVDLYVLLRQDAASLQGQFAHILVDEFQDTSLLQYEILRTLAGPPGRLYAVGDVDQAIYSWRGAGPEVFLRFAEDYPQTGRVILHRNYRASETLVDTTNALIAVNEKRTPKRIRGVREGGFAPEVIGPSDDTAEAVAIADRLQRLHEQEGAPWREMTVIYRNNYQALPFIAEFSRRGIPFRMLGEPPNPFRHWVGQDVLAYVRLALGPVDPQLLERIMYRPNRYISNAATRAAAGALLAGAPLTEAYAALDLRPHQLDRITQLEQHLWRLQRLAPAEAVAFVRETIGYDEYLQERFANAPARRSEATAMAALLQNVAVGFARLCDFIAFGAVVQNRTRGWWRLLAEADDVTEGLSGLTQVEANAGTPDTAQPSVRANRPLQENGGDAITLTTCHSAKGLEFDAVAVSGLVEGVLPAAEADLEEERRLAYVALTRARERLILSGPAHLLGEKRSPSRFIYEATGVEPASPAPAAGPTSVGEQIRVVTPGVSAEVLAEAVARFVPDAPVRHKTFGQGRVRSVDGDKGYVTVDFEHYGEKQLLLETCVEKSLLERVER